MHYLHIYLIGIPIMAFISGLAGGDGMSAALSSLFWPIILILAVPYSMGNAFLSKPGAVDDGNPSIYKPGAK